MSEVTITLDEETTKWAQERAEKQEVSLSQYVAGAMRDRMLTSRPSDEARRQFFSVGPWDLSGARFKSRDELYDRKSFR